MGLGIALAKQQHLMEAKEREAREQRERHEKALAAERDRLNPYAIKKSTAHNTAGNVLSPSK